jgi:hypothetical protein
MSFSLKSVYFSLRLYLYFLHLIAFYNPESWSNLKGIDISGSHFERQYSIRYVF